MQLPVIEFVWSRLTLNFPIFAASKETFLKDQEDEETEGI